jgi:hypothetical protein
MWFRTRENVKVIKNEAIDQARKAEGQKIDSNDIYFAKSDLSTRVLPMMPAMKEAQLRLPLSLGTEMNLLTSGSFSRKISFFPTFNNIILKNKNIT